MKNRSFLVVMVLVAAAAFMTGACSRSKTIKTEGGEITLDKEGGAISIKTKEGKAVASFGSGAQIPNNLPKDIPVYKPADVTMSQVMGDGEKFMLGLSTKDDSKAVAKFYNTALPNKGWKIGNVLSMGPTTILQGKKGSQKLLVTINTDDKQTIISLAYTGK